MPRRLPSGHHRRLGPAREEQGQEEEGEGGSKSRGMVEVRFAATDSGRSAALGWPGEPGVRDRANPPALMARPRFGCTEGLAAAAASILTSCAGVWPLVRDRGDVGVVLETKDDFVQESEWACPIWNGLVSAQYDEICVRSCLQRLFRTSRLKRRCHGVNPRALGL